MTSEETKKRRKIHIRKLLCECIDSLNDPEGSEIVDMIYWIKSNKDTLIFNESDVAGWVRELENEQIVFHYNIPFRKPKKYKLCIGYSHKLT